MWQAWIDKRQARSKQTSGCKGAKRSRWAGIIAANMPCRPLLSPSGCVFSQPSILLGPEAFWCQLPGGFKLP